MKTCVEQRPIGRQRAPADEEHARPGRRDEAFDQVSDGGGRAVDAHVQLPAPGPGGEGDLDHMWNIVCFQGVPGRPIQAGVTRRPGRANIPGPGPPGPGERSRPWAVSRTESWSSRVRRAASARPRPGRSTPRART